MRMDEFPLSMPAHSMDTPNAHAGPLDVPVHDMNMPAQDMAMPVHAMEMPAHEM